LNAYGYVGGNPINRIDEKGLFYNCNTFNGVCQEYPDPGVPNNLGDMVSKPNGNLWNGTEPQDGVCTLPGQWGVLADTCVIERCQRHDQCYADNECNLSSWIPNILGGDKSCNKCNSGFFDEIK